MEATMDEPKEDKGGGSAAPSDDGSLGIGSLKSAKMESSK